MKKLLLVFVAIAITAGAYAQIDSTNRKMSPRNMNNQNQNVQYNPDDKSHPDGVMMQNGKMMRVKNGQMTSLQENDMTLTNGTKIMSDGTCIKKDGTKMTMKEGQHMDMSGNIGYMKTNKDNNMDLNQNVQNDPVYKSHPDGVMMQNGKMMKVKNGQMTNLQDNDMTMSNGTKIMSDGTCIEKNGTKTTMKEGQHMDMSGNMIPMNSNKDRNMDLNQNMPVDKLHSDGVMMQNGKMMKVKNGQMTNLQDNDMTMSNGTQIMSDGTCIKKDGTKMTMKEGQHMDMSGNMNPVNSNKDRNMYLVPDSTRKNYK